MHSWVIRCRFFIIRARRSVDRAFGALRTQSNPAAFVACSVVAFTIAIAIGISLTREAGNAASIWPANAILVTALLVAKTHQTRTHLIVFGLLCNFLIMMAIGDGPIASLSYATINAAEIYLTVRMMRSYSYAPSNFTNPTNLWKFTSIGFLTPIVPSLAGAFVISSLYGTDFWSVARTWFCSDALGLLIIVPAIFLVFERDLESHPQRSTIEITASLLALLAITGFVFYQTQFPLLFLVQAVVARIAFRLGPSYTAAAVLVTAALAIGFTVLGHGPAMLGRGADLAIRIEIVQLFVLVMFFTALPAANAFAEQIRLQRGLDHQIKTRDELALKLQINKTHLDSALNNMALGLCLYDGQSRIVLRNEPFARIYGLDPDDIKCGMSLREVIEMRIAHGVFAGDSPEQYMAERLTPVETEAYKLHHLNDGRTIAIWHTTLPDGGWVTTQEDITETRRIEKRLAFLAHHDALTGLANRVLLQDRIEMTLTRVRRGEEAAVLFLDLDNFKSVNDTFGHNTGDELLKIVAGRLRAGLRETDTIARLGGDEFAILLVGGKQPEGAGVVARRITELMAAPIDINGNQIRIGTSIGIATAPFDSETTIGLLKCADLALYKAKDEGRGSHRFFELDMDVRMQDRLRLEQDLRAAIENQDFTIHYQPLLDLHSDQVTGFEALIRWHHAERGMISPADFIPLAEETGLILPLGLWVLNKACQDAARWPDHLKVAVNISPAQLMAAGVTEIIAAALLNSGLSPHRLQLEITETAVMENADKAFDILRRLRATGVEIAMDDFGTGYSSLSSLRNFPFNKIKIDRSFINDLTTSPQSRAILRAIISLAKTLGMTTTAEGVETAEQLAIVRAEGCSEMQGYFFSKPKPLEYLGEFLRAIPLQKIA